MRWNERVMSFAHTVNSNVGLHAWSILRGYGFGNNSGEAQEVGGRVLCEDSRFNIPFPSRRKCQRHLEKEGKALQLREPGIVGVILRQTLAANRNRAIEDGTERSMMVACFDAVHLKVNAPGDGDTGRGEANLAGLIEIKGSPDLKKRMATYAQLRCDLSPPGGSRGIPQAAQSQEICAQWAVNVAHALAPQVQRLRTSILKKEDQIKKLRTDAVKKCSKKGVQAAADALKKCNQKSVQADAEGWNDLRAAQKDRVEGASLVKGIMTRTTERERMITNEIHAAQRAEKEIDVVCTTLQAMANLPSLVEESAAASIGFGET